MRKTLSIIGLLKLLALQIRPIGRLRNSRDAIRAERDALSDQIADLRRAASTKQNFQSAQSGTDSNRFFHYDSRFDAMRLMRQYADSQVSAHPSYLTNYLGVRTDPRFFPGILDGRAGEVEPIPIPANWHTDIAEWGAVLRAVDLARDHFCVVELGCGWGCWLNNAGAAARRRGLTVSLHGIEAAVEHLGFAKESLDTNGFLPEQFTLNLGVAAGRDGTALFPRQSLAGDSWGMEPIFGATDQQRRDAETNESHLAVPMISLETFLEPISRIDLLHMDIQGGEGDLVAEALSTLCEKVAYLVIGTHSRSIEGLLCDVLLGAGWRLEIERPCVTKLEGTLPFTDVDGVQGWRNPRFHPENP